MVDSLHAISVGVDNERGVIVLPVFSMETRSAVIRSPHRHCGIMERQRCLHRRGLEGDMEPFVRGDRLSLRFERERLISLAWSSVARSVGRCPHPNIA